MRFILSIILHLVPLFISAQGIWLSPQRGFDWKEGFNTNGKISNTSDSTASRSIDFEVGKSDFRIAIQLANLHSDPHKQYSYFSSTGTQQKASLPGYSIILSGSVQLIIDTDLTLQGVEPFEKLTPQWLLTFNGETTELTPKGDFKTDQKPNLIIITRKDNLLTVEAGHSEAGLLWSSKIPADFTVSNLKVDVEPGGELLVEYLHIDTPWNAQPLTPENTSVKDIVNTLQSTGDPYAGYWIMTGRELDEKQLRSGGNYTITLLPCGVGHYNIYYLAGATIYPLVWQPGMYKGCISRVIHPRYDARWLDTEGNFIEDAIALFPDNDTFTIQFPYYDGASITFQRLPAAPLDVIMPADTANP